MKTKITILFLLAMTGLGGIAQTCQWAKQSTNGYLYFHDMMGSHFGYSDVTTDINNNVIVDGKFVSDTLALGSTTLVNNTYYGQLFVAKYDNVSGDLLWAKSSRSPHTAYGCTLYHDMCTDMNGNIFITTCWGSGSFPDDTMIIDSDTILSKGTFILKFAPDGTLLWSKSFNYGYVSNISESASICTDNNGNLFITGNFGGPSLIIGHDTLINHDLSLTTTDVFLAKLDPFGNELWAKGLGGNDYDYGKSVTVDPPGNVYLYGTYCSQSLTIGNTTLVNNNYDTVMPFPSYFFSKFDVSGNSVWTKNIELNGNYPIYDCGVIKGDNYGNIYMNGFYDSGYVALDTITIHGTNQWNQWNSFFAKYNGNGNIQWVKQCGGISQPLANGDVFLTGSYVDSVVLDAITLYGTSNNFVSQFNGAGHVISAQNFPVTGRIDNNGSIYATGIFTDPTITYNNFTLNNPYALTIPNTTFGVYYLVKYLQSQCSAYFTLQPDTNQLHHYIAVNYANGIQPMHYSWSWGDGSTNDTVPYPSHVYANAGTYTICLSIIDSSGCTSSYCDSSYQILRTTNTMAYVNVHSPVVAGIKPLSYSINEIKIYPNPANTTLNIHQSSTSPNEQLIITDILGHEVYKAPLTAIDNTIELTKWSNGVYFYEVRSEKETFRGKIIRN